MISELVSSSVKALVKSHTQGETRRSLKSHTLLNTLLSVSRVCQDSVIDCFCPARLSVVGRSCPSSGCSAGFSAGPVEHCGAQSPDPPLVTRRKTEPTGTTQTTDWYSVLTFLLTQISKNGTMLLFTYTINQIQMVYDLSPMIYVSSCDLNMLTTWKITTVI